MYVDEENLTSAYLKSLEKVVKYNYIFTLVIRVKKPIIDFDSIVDDELKLIGVNLDLKLHNKFKSFVFSDGKTGSWWIKDRVNVLLKGIYHKAITNYDQLNFVQKALKEIRRRKYTWSSNRLLCFTFNPYDKRLSHTHLERQPVPPCLTLVDFKPERNVLHLIASWRAQFFDTKAYGNLISLAVLLRDICKNTGYSPGQLISIAHKAILKNRKDARNLLQRLKS
ncbi:MAG: hypothetical protein DRJ32_06110 [Thermoprotei archaeon]|nr:MAG: hypothetical protein DRJ32_06110 [Thermoprotei archaeon]